MSVDIHRQKTNLRKGTKLATTRAPTTDGNPTSSPSNRRESTEGQRRPRCSNKANWKSHKGSRSGDQRLSVKPSNDNALVQESLGVHDNPKSKFKTGKFNNELLNFNYDIPSSRQNHQRVGYGRSRHYSFSRHSKEVFLQAKFVVKSNEDYSKHSIDPDLLVDWNHIEQVRLSSDEIPNCPICLFDPKVARITKCGHVYCWSCINHYLKLGTKNYRKCPICFEDIHSEDLRSAVSEAKHKYAIGDKITMALMKREKGSSDAHPVNKPDDLSFTKLIPASSGTILNDIILPEKAALIKQLETAIMEESDEICFIESAITALTEKEAVILSDTSNDTSTPPVSNIVAGEERRLEDKQVFDFDQCHVEGIEDRNAIHKDLKSSNYYYFYQDSDGQNLFVHPINARCLVKEYGSLDQCPETITASILTMESLSVNEETRKKFRYLNHLPKTCEFTICELMLRPPDVSRETLALFTEEFRKRKQQRQQKKREDRRSERRYEANCKFDEYGREQHRTEHNEDIQLSSLAEFPQQLKVPYNGAFECDSPLSEVSDSPLLRSPISEVCQAMSTTMSFAQTLEKSVSNKNEWKPLAKKQPAAAQASGNGWPSHAVWNSSDDDCGVDCDYDATPVPSYADSFVMALQMPKEVANANEEEKLSKLGRKQKKKGKQLLFSTGSTRKY